jgi:hypothetical protein
MKKLSLAFPGLHLASFALKAAQPEINPPHIDVHVTPYYDSKGPAVKVGRFSAGLASAKENDFITTIAEMKKDWNRLTFPELYIGAIRLYDWAIEKKQFTGFILPSIVVDSLVSCWIRPGWEASVAQGLSCCTPRTLLISSWGPTSMVTPSVIPIAL